jgi:hypothetical protein
MNASYEPVIVVVSFNREKSLKRLLFSLKNAVYSTKTKIIISIDRGDDNKIILDIAKEFRWPHGEKEVVYQKKKLGLKRHIMKCADLVNVYGSVIILEDDLFVSKYFYDYAKKALNYYSSDNKIAGISLYKYPAIERRINPFPFTPLIDNSDVHFIQFAASWGEAWTKDQWNGFRKWYDELESGVATLKEKFVQNVPFTVLDWPMKSWKKFFILYMIMHDKYFVYPNQSLTTNFDDRGTNRLSATCIYQVPLKFNDELNYNFLEISKAVNVYDASFELVSSTFKKYNPKLANFDFDTDLYGFKKPFELKKSHVLTTQKTRRPIFEFARKLKPHEMNVLMDLPGPEITLTQREDIIGLKKISKNHGQFYEKKMQEQYNDMNYFFRNPGTMGDSLKIFMYQLAKKIKNI